MSAGKIIAGVGITAGVVGLAYYGYTKYAAKETAPAAGSLIPAGTNPSTGVQQFINTSTNDIVDAAGAIINAVKPVAAPGTTVTDNAGNTFALSTATEKGGYVVLVNGSKNGGGIKFTTSNGSVFLENKQGAFYKFNNSSKRWDQVPGISGLRGFGSPAAAYRMLN